MRMGQLVFPRDEPHNWLSNMKRTLCVWPYHLECVQSHPIPNSLPLKHMHTSNIIHSAGKLLQVYMCIDLCYNKFERKWVAYKKLEGMKFFKKKLFLETSAMFLCKSKAEGFYVSNTQENVLWDTCCTSITAQLTGLSCSHTLLPSST